MKTGTVLHLDALPFIPINHGEYCRVEDGFMYINAVDALTREESMIKVFSVSEECEHTYHIGGHELTYIDGLLQIIDGNGPFPFYEYAPKGLLEKIVEEIG